MWTKQTTTSPRCMITDILQITFYWFLKDTQPPPPHPYPLHTLPSLSLFPHTNSLPPPAARQITPTSYLIHIPPLQPSAAIWIDARRRRETGGGGTRQSMCVVQHVDILIVSVEEATHLETQNGKWQTRHIQSFKMMQNKQLKCFIII